jgi:hypothetical protein
MEGYADDCNIYVQSRRAGERVMASLTRFLAERLRLAVNLVKSAVDRPWNRSFLGYTVTAHKEPRLRVAAKSVARLRDKLRDLFRHGRGQSIGRTVETLTPLLRGWIQYFRLAQVKGVFEELDGWLAQAALRPVAAVEAAAHPRATLDATGSRRGSGSGVRLQWTRSLVERRGQPHARRLPKDLLRTARAFLSPGAAPPPTQRCMNRRIRNRTSGGVGVAPCKRMEFSRL